MDLRALIFMPALAGSVIFGCVFVLFAASYFLTVLESTSSGAREVVWTEDSIPDKAVRAAYMLWLVGLWLGPAYLIGVRLTSGSDSPWLKLLVPVLVFWIAYPISQLSSLSASTVWLPLVPGVFGRLAKKPAVYLGFMAITVPCLAVLAVGFKWAFLTDRDWGLLFVGCPLLVISGLVYARLIGRLAFVLSFTRGYSLRKKKRKPRREEDPARDTDEEPRQVLTQPSDLPPIITPDEGELTGYDLHVDEEVRPVRKKRLAAEVIDREPETEGVHPSEEDSLSPGHEGKKAKPRKARPKPHDDEDDVSPYDVHNAEIVPGEQVPESLAKPLASELRLLGRSDAPRPPKRAWDGDTLVFLFQNGTISAVLIASFLCWLVGLMVRVARIFNPVSGGD
jgi:hypothetical protein